MRAYLVLSAVLLLGQFGFAQMTYDYSSYDTNSFDSTHIYVTAVVDGSATCNNIHIESLNCSAVTHQGQVYVELGNTGGWVYGPKVNPNNYISVSNAQSITPTPGAEYTLNADGAVFCSAAGTVFLEEFPTEHFEFAWTMGKYTGIKGLCNPTTLECAYYVMNWCTSGTTPPDDDLTGQTIADVVQYNYWKVLSECVSLNGHQPWACNPKYNLALGYSAAQPLYACTSNP